MVRVLIYQQSLLATMLCPYLSTITVLLIVGEDDLHAVRSAVADLTTEWMDFGISLGVHKTDLDTILSANSHSPSNCLREMLTLWLRQSYAVSTTFIFHPLCLIYYPTFNMMVGKILHAC